LFRIFRAADRNLAEDGTSVAMHRLLTAGIQCSGVFNGDGKWRSRNADMTDKATYDRLEKDVTAVKNDIAALTGQITDAINTFAGDADKQAKHGYRQARAQVDSTVDDMSERGSAMMDAAQDAAYSIGETLEDVITQRPLATIGLALGLGLLIGATWRR
jgi:ElaB/YqjD/DUF883 family membrane-anchored ribosome-binding protein